MQAIKRALWGIAKCGESCVQPQAAAAAYNCPLLTARSLMVSLTCDTNSQLRTADQTVKLLIGRHVSDALHSQQRVADQGLGGDQAGLDEEGTVGRVVYSCITQYRTMQQSNISS